MEDQRNSAPLPTPTRLPRAAKIGLVAAGGIVGCVGGQLISAEYAPQQPIVWEYRGPYVDVQGGIPLVAVKADCFDDENQQLCAEGFVESLALQAGVVSSEVSSSTTLPGDRLQAERVDAEGLDLVWKNDSRTRESGEGRRRARFKGVCAVETEEPVVVAKEYVSTTYPLGSFLGAGAGAGLALAGLGAANRLERRLLRRKGRREEIGRIVQQHGASWRKERDDVLYDVHDQDTEKEFFSLVLGNGSFTEEELKLLNKKFEKGRWTLAQRLGVAAPLVALTMIGVGVYAVSEKNESQAISPSPTRPQQFINRSGQGAPPLTSPTTAFNREEWARSHRATLVFEGCDDYVVNGERLPLGLRPTFDKAYSQEILQKLTAPYFSTTTTFAGR